MLFHGEFDAEFEALSEDVQDNLLAAAKAVQIAGPKAGRPHVDTLSRRSRNQTGCLALTPLLSRFRTVATAQRSEIERRIQNRILLQNCQQYTRKCLNGSKHANMKELRFTAHGGREVWRAAFAFDPGRAAIVPVAGEKQCKNQALFYKRLIKIADGRFDSHLRQVKAATIVKR